MSGSESEALSAIVVGSPKSVNEAITLNEDTKLCSSCRHDKAISHFIGSSSRHKGQEMRTCAECRIKNTRVPVRRYKKRMPITKKSAPENSNAEQGRKGRASRRQTTSKTTSSTGTATTKTLARASASIVGKQPTATYTMPPKSQTPRKSLAVTTPALAPAIIDLSSHEPGQDDDNTDTDDEYYQPPPVRATQSLKRQSTPPHSPGEDIDHEAIQVQQPPPKRQRISAVSTVPRTAELEADVEVEDEVEENEPALNANGHLVGSDLAAFAASLGRLSQLLVSAGKNLDHERIGALESEIHHDWRVDEMATFVEGFLKGAAANAVGKGW